MVTVLTERPEAPAPTGLVAFPITPSRDGRIDTDALQTLLARLLAAGVQTIGLLGSTGSYPYFSRAERRRAVQAAMECIGGRAALMVGCGAAATAEALACTADAADAGAASGLLAPVSYAPLTEPEVYGLFEDVAQVGLPLCIYNNPRNTQFDITPALTGRIAALPGVIAAKHPAPPAARCADELATLRELVPEGFSVGFSVDWHAPRALLAGGDAWYSVLAGLHPAPCLALTAAARRGDTAELARLDAQLEPLWTLMRRHGSYRVMHLAANLLGIANALPPRPVRPLDGDAAREVRTVLERLDLGRSSP